MGNISLYFPCVIVFLYVLFAPLFYVVIWECKLCHLQVRCLLWEVYANSLYYCNRHNFTQFIYVNIFNRFFTNLLNWIWVHISYCRNNCYIQSSRLSNKLLPALWSVMSCNVKWISIFISHSTAISISKQVPLDTRHTCFNISIARVITH